MDRLDTICRFARLVDMAEAVFGASATWEQKYDTIFGLCREIYPLLDALGERLDYYDPDTTYEEDTVAAMEALREKRTNLLEATDLVGAGIVED